MQQYILAIDQGTTSTRTILLGQAGYVADKMSRYTNLSSLEQMQICYILDGKPRYQNYELQHE